MKRASFLIVLLFSLSFADVIPIQLDCHWVENEVFITNASSFPQYKVIGFIKNVPRFKDTAYIIQDSVKLFSGNRYSAFSLFAIRKSLLDSCGGLGGLNFEAITAHVTGTSIVDPTGRYIPDSIPMIKDTYYYRIESVNDSTLVLKLAKRIKHYSDGRSDEIEEY